MKGKVVEVKRLGSWIMKVKVALAEEMINISVYVPQSCYEEEEKLKFWQDMDEMLMSICEDEKLVIGSDLNGHIGTVKRVIFRIHGGGKKKGMPKIKWWELHKDEIKTRLKETSSDCCKDGM
ncbi:uncharacterized protein LOC125031651 [Penaeus chinensis]|uniref:uncharacterized protein LOC125031651 n=1 Tax=Penaeus chinensis TaxID=139456 RepID=UPI001FB78A1E|nr:uncharacterized protein LOC125031651 [Penaeus chinensis]